MNSELSKNENLQNIIKIYKFYNIKHKYPERLIAKTYMKHQKLFIQFDFYIEYYTEFLCLNTNTKHEIFLHDLFNNNIRTGQIHEIETLGYKFIRHRQIFIITHNSIKNIKPVRFTRQYIPKPSIMCTLLRLIDTNPDLLYEISSKYDTPLREYVFYKKYKFNYD